MNPSDPVIVPGSMEVRATAAGDADTIAVGLFEGGSVEGPAAALVESGEARAKPGRTAIAHDDGRRWVVVGLGARDAWDAEAARGAAAAALGRAREAGGRVLAWESAEGQEAGIVEGSVLAAYRFDRYKRGEDDDERGGIEQLRVDGDAAAVERAAVVAA